jgi:hypothetical protein
MLRSSKRFPLRRRIQLAVASALSLLAGLGIYAARADRPGLPGIADSKGSTPSTRLALSPDAAGRGGADGDPRAQGAKAGFSITGNALGVLYPGGGSEQVALTIANPNGHAIEVTALNATVTGGSAGCPPTGNVLIIQSNIAAQRPLRVAGHSSVTLPAQGVAAPRIMLLNSLANQDACENAGFQLSYTGSARS